MFSTSSKIVLGYIVLVGLLMGAFTYTIQQMNLLTTPSTSSWTIAATSPTASSANCMMRKSSVRPCVPAN